MPRAWRLLPVLPSVVLVLLVGCSSLDLSPKPTIAKPETPAPDDVSPSPSPRISPKTHLAAGQMLEQQGDLQGAIPQYEKAVAADPRFTPAYNRLGIIYQRLGRFEDADRILIQGLKADPGSATLANNLGYSLLQQGRLPEAEKAFRQALMISPQFKRARMNLGIVLAKTDRIEASLTEFSQVVSADQAQFNVGLICLEQGRLADAEKAFQTALEINDQCPGADAYLQRVRFLAARGGKRGREPVEKPVAAEPPLAGNVSDQGSDTLP